MLICCVKQGNKYGDEYVRKLQRGISNHLTGHQGHIFTCFTDNPVEGVLCEPLPATLPGWWAKIGLFKLKEPLIYFDLDVVLTGNLEPLLNYEGFGIIKDWWQPTFNSSVMKLTGEEGHVWDSFTDDTMKKFRGDQDFILSASPDAATFPAEWFPSFKANHCEDAAPKGAIAVIFHGLPKPHQCGGWVNTQWS